MKILAEQGDKTDSATALASAQYEIPLNTTIRIQIVAVARGQAPNTGRATFTRNAIVSRGSADTLTVDAAGTLDTVANAGAAGWTISPVIAGPRVVVQVVGAAGVGVFWQTEIDGMSVTEG